MNHQSPRFSQVRCRPVLFLLLSCLTALPARSAIQDLEAWIDADGRGNARWTTTEPTRGTLEWGMARDRLDRQVEEDPSCLRGTTNNRDSGRGWANNHRADFAIPKDVAAALFFRIRAQSREGKELMSPVRSIPAPTPAGRDRSESGAVTVTVDAGDWPYDPVPVTFGLPLPPGALADSARIRLVAGRTALPVQTRAVTRRRKDGSLKWLRLDTLVPRGTHSFRVEYGLGSPPVPGASSAAAPAPRTALAQWTAGLVLTDSDGRSYAFRPESVEWEEFGPVRRVVRAVGPLRSADGRRFFRVVLRGISWPGQPWRRWDVTLENDRTKPEMTAFRSFQLRIPHRDGPVVVGRKSAQVRLDAGARVFQREDFEWIVEPGGKPRRGHIDGIVRTAPDKSQVLRYFWQSWPAAVSRTNDALVIGFCPRLPPKFYANRPDEDKLYYHIRDGRHTVRQGWSRTWTLWEVSGAAAAAGVVGLAGEMPVAALPPEWIEKTDVFGPMAVAVRGRFPGYDETMAHMIDGYEKSRARMREYGMMNFGDWYGERRWNWGNLEYDLGHALLTQFMRTGYAPFRRRAAEIIRHQRDVDTRHYAGDPRRVGQQWIHSMGHTAGYYTNDYKHMKRYAGDGWSDNRGHIWAQGMFEDYLLGGDARSWATARLIADWAAGPQTTNFTFGNAREPGWMLKLVMSAYAATDDPFYLNAARIMIREVHRKSEATGGHGFYYHPLPRGHCNCPAGARHKGEAGFMLGVLMTGMKMVWDVTHEDAVATDIANTARFIVDTMWDPDVEGFRYTSCPRTRPTTTSAWIMLEGLAFGARHLHDARMNSVCRRALAAAWSAMPTRAKSAGYVYCNSARGLEQAARLPGPSFRGYLLHRQAILRSPVRRALPTLVPNPDFEESIRGWPTRGWQIERSTTVRHGGSGALRISGTCDGQNEYVNTSYDTTGSPDEITWLRPGGEYELSAWLRVDRITPTAPRPSLRIAFRDAMGTREAATTNAYDLARRETWQRLSVRFKVPKWNTRNYIALNTNSRKAIDAELYLDDIHLTPVKTPAPSAPAVLRLDPPGARLEDGATLRPNPDFRDAPWLAGPGSAVWRVNIPSNDRWELWARVAAGANFARVVVNGKPLARDVRTGTATWLPLGSSALPTGPCEVRLEGLAPNPAILRLVLTNVASERPK
ncbi:MAG: hypothetical protein GXP31_02415 [Kiritimatiellaeota bacterium]|nr:hypothetical protein [Kiritimatiellota bacterium]